MLGSRTTPKLAKDPSVDCLSMSHFTASLMTTASMYVNSAAPANVLATRAVNLDHEKREDECEHNYALKIIINYEKYLMSNLKVLNQGLICAVVVSEGSWCMLFNTKRETNKIVKNNGINCDCNVMQ